MSISMWLTLTFKGMMFMFDIEKFYLPSWKAKKSVYLLIPYAQVAQNFPST